MRIALLDPLVFSSTWVGAAAAVLSTATSLAMGSPPSGLVAGLAFCGTLVVYNVDRLRDLPRDRETSPLRSAFVTKHRRSLGALASLAGIVAAVLVLQAGWAAVALLAPVLAAGLLHRRLKRFGWWKPFYISAAWIAVVVGLPALLAAEPVHVAWTGAVVGAALLANAIASNLRDDEAVSARFGAGVPLALARGCAALGTLMGLLAPAPVRTLALVPATTLAALAGFREGERYGLVVVDGALLVGALLALPLLT